VYQEYEEVVKLMNKVHCSMLSLHDLQRLIVLEGHKGSKLWRDHAMMELDIWVLLRIDLRKMTKDLMKVLL
jgi:nitric oxide synthase oxygenase domain/subunit